MAEMIKTNESESKTIEGFKKTKTGWIPEDWEVVPIGDLYQFKNGLNKEKEFFGYGTPIINYNDVFKNNSLNTNTIRGLVSLNVNEINRFNVKKGDVFFTRTSETIEQIGYSAVLTEDIKDGVFSGFLLRARPNKPTKIDIEFARYCFSSDYVRKEVMRKSTYTTRALTNGRYLSEVNMLLPSLHEQQKIAFILSDWDEAIEKTQTLVGKLELRKKGLMQQLLTGKTRLAGFTGKWKKVSISEIAKQFTDKNKNDEEIEVLSCTKYDGLVRSLDYFGRKVFGDDLSKYKIVPRGYFAYATNHIEEGSIGYQDLMERGLVSPMYTVFKTDDTINDSFMFRLLKTDRMIYNYQSNMSGSIARRGGLRWNVFETIIVKIPSKEEQNYIAEFFDKIDEEITQIENYLEQLQSQKKGLMQELLTGKIRAKE